MHIDKDLQKLKADQTFFGWAWSKMGMANLVTNGQIGQADFLHAGKNSGRFWGGCGQIWPWPPSS